MQVNLNRSPFKVDAEVSGHQIRKLDDMKFIVGPFKIKENVDEHVKIVLEYAMRNDIADTR